MLDAVVFAVQATLIVGVVLAVAHDVPIIELFGRRHTANGRRAAILVGGPVVTGFALHLGGVTVYGVHPLTIAGPIALAYLWFCMSWRLRPGAAKLAVVSPQGSGITTVAIGVAAKAAIRQNTASFRRGSPHHCGLCLDPPAARRN